MELQVYHRVLKGTISDFADHDKIDKKMVETSYKNKINVEKKTPLKLEFAQCEICNKWFRSFRGLG